MTAYYNDHDPKVCDWLEELIRRGNLPDGVVDRRSILDVRAEDLTGFAQCHFFAGIGGWPLALRLAGIPDDRPVWTGSPPCQPFSAAGARKGKDDARHLAPHFADLIAAGRPPALFGEQVASSEVFGKAASGARKITHGTPEWAWIDDLSARLEAAHYAIGASDLPSSSVGAPHIRQRCFFGAIRLADADGWDASAEREQPGREHGQQPADGGAVRRDDSGAWTNPPRGMARPSPTDGFWRDADWLHCRDGKWRPVEARSQQMADGLPEGMGRGGDFRGFDGSQEEKAWAVAQDEIGFPLGKVSYARAPRLRGYGNAINPWLAAEFVRAFGQAVMEVDFDAPAAGPADLFDGWAAE